jgi:hypothetical protein
MRLTEVLVRHARACAMLHLAFHKRDSFYSTGERSEVISNIEKTGGVLENSKFVTY